MTLYAILQQIEEDDTAVIGLTITYSRALEIVTLLSLRDGAIYGIKEIPLLEGECYMTSTNDYIVDIWYKKGEEPVILTKHIKDGEG